MGRCVGVGRPEGPLPALRQLDTWNDHGADWEERGTEHAAEIISWALCDQGTGTHLPSVPRNDPAQVAEAYLLLTGLPLPELTADTTCDFS